MAPTILQMLRLPLRDEFDRAPIAYTDRTMSTSDKYELVNVESWDSGHTPIGVQNSAYYNNTYKALRLVSNNYSFFYSKWCTGEREFYDMKSDFVQMNNRLGSNPIGKESSILRPTRDRVVSSPRCATDGLQELQAGFVSGPMGRVVPQWRGH